MADDGLLHQPGVDQLANAHIRARCIVGDERQILLSLTHQFIDKILRRPDADKSADHQDGSIWYPSHGFLGGIHLVHF
ncbi:hypothetical protein D3C73_796880 [compost metagenome]